MGPAELAGEMLNRQARKAAEALQLPCHVLGSDERRMRDELFAEFWFRMGDTRPASPDSGFVSRTVGLLQFTVYAPLGTDVSEIMPFVGHLKRSFDQQTWTYRDGMLKTGLTDAKQIPPRFRYGRLIWVVDASFDLLRGD